MIRDFIRFFHHLLAILRFAQGILAALATLLLLCTVVIVVAEGMRFGPALYFVLITALTIGYGDITPTTTLGAIASVATGVIGLLFNGIIVAVTVRALGDAVREKIEKERVGTSTARAKH